MHNGNGRGVFRVVAVALSVLSPVVLSTIASQPVLAEDSGPPEGFRALFNGKDLTGWHGMNPHSVANLTGDQKAAALAKQRTEFPQHWRVEGGELVNDGEGPYATTDEEFGDIELRIEYKTVPKADSGIYLRGQPQVQIWDWNQVFDPKNPRGSRIWARVACSTTHREPPAAIRSYWRTARSANGTPSAFGRSARSRPFG